MLRILLAEDHPIVRRGVRALLEAEPGVSVCAEASNGIDAVALATKEHPDIVVLDCSMPEMSGIEAARLIHQATPAAQILVFTQHDTDDVIRQALQVGARGFLLKSEADEHLVHAVHALALKRPYFTGRVAEAMLANFLDRTTIGPLLTGRERETVRLVAEGHSNKDIATVFSVSSKTVETHRASAMRKLGVKSAAELIRYAVRNKLVDG